MSICEKCRTFAAKMRKLLLIVVVLGCLFVRPESAFARKTEQPVAEQDSTNIPKAKLRWNKFLAFADRWFSRGIDTTYLALPKYPFRIAYRSEVGGAHTSLDAEDLPYFGNLTARFHTNPTPKMGANIAFRNFNLGYMVDLFKGYSNFGLAFVQNAWGLDIQRRKTSYAHGYFDSSEIEGKSEIEAGDISMTTLFVSTYYAFNNKKFSMPAALKQSYIQRKSAGAPLLYADFRYSDLMFKDETRIVQAGGTKNMELYQIAVGVGYGYNYTPNNGKVLLHLTFIPMLTVFNQMLMTGDSRMFWHNDEYNFNLVFSRKLKPRYPVFFTGMARAAFVWNINDRLVLALSGVCHNIRFRMRDKMFEIDREDLELEYNATINTNLMTWDWKFDLIFGVRF